jgi:hypothetical protein
LGTSNFKTAFFIRENQSRLAMLPEDNMHIEIRSSLIIFPWSREDFERLKLKMLIKYPATLSLWNELKRNAV